MQNRQSCDFWTKIQKCPKTLKTRFLRLFESFWRKKIFLKFFEIFFSGDPKFSKKKKNGN